ncbi:MAG: MgtC/SapB family protein [Flavobacteriales bacterium]
MTGELPALLVRLLISLGIGFLIGLEREYAKRALDKEEQFAGVRTYTLISLFGFLASFLADRHGEGVFIAALCGFIAIVIASYVMTAKAGNYGITTELSAIITFLLGSVVFEGNILFAVIITVILTSLLSLKLPLHRFITSLTAQDIRAFIQFVIISAVVLPFLPDDDFGPYDVWNLRNIWTMVIVVTGISLAGYLLSKILGGRRGTLLAGIVGGLVSSTAVTLSFARRAREHPSGSRMVAAVAIVAASVILYPRILLETWLVNRPLAQHMALPIAFITVVGLVTTFLMHRRPGGTTLEEVPLTNPLNFGVAVQFALAYMAVLWLIAFASEHYSAQGLYAAGLIFGATDMDAITLSVARKAIPEQNTEAVTAILLATLSNTAMKYMIVVFFGDGALRKAVGIGFAALFIAGALGIATMRLF